MEPHCIGPWFVAKKRRVAAFGYHATFVVHSPCHVYLYMCESVCCIFFLRLGCLFSYEIKRRAQVLGSRTKKTFASGAVEALAAFYLQLFCSALYSVSQRERRRESEKASESFYQLTGHLRVRLRKILILQRSCAPGCTGNTSWSRTNVCPLPLPPCPHLWQCRPACRAVGGAVGVHYARG